jgi:hypothetical protein
MLLCYEFEKEKSNVNDYKNEPDFSYSFIHTYKKYICANTISL